jgi:hypothetical protein
MLYIPVTDVLMSFWGCFRRWCFVGDVFVVNAFVDDAFVSMLLLCYCYFVA